MRVIILFIAVFLLFGCGTKYGEWKNKSQVTKIEYLSVNGSFLSKGRIYTIIETDSMVIKFYYMLPIKIGNQCKTRKSYNSFYGNELNVKFNNENYYWITL